MMLRVLLALVSCCVACTDATTTRPRSWSMHNNDATRPVGNDDLHGGTDMPGKGRGSEHDRHR